MRFAELIEGRFVRRYKRFFVDVELDDGSTVVAHCPNTGTLLGCLEEGAPVLLQPADNPARKLRFTWKAIQLDGGWVGVDTGVAVPLVEEAIAAGLPAELSGYPRCLREVRYGREGRSRIDLLLSRGGTEPAPAKKGRARALPEGDERVYVEVKNTTLVRDGVAAFPDAVTTRGQKHLEELADVVSQGHRAAMVYCVQREDAERFEPATDIDPEYARLLERALAAGVEAYALSAQIGKGGVTLHRVLPFSLG